jgi:glycosyltransferase involved in cell wall biosynthesis
MIKKKNTLQKKVLIATLPPEIFGGVHTMSQILADHLFKEGYDVTIAYYCFPRHHPNINTTVSQLFLFRHPRIRIERQFNGHDCRAVGCYLPEIETSYTRPSKLWGQLIREHDLHFSVGGTLAISNIFKHENIPFIAWCASDIVGDRFARQASMSVLRRNLDRMIITPYLQKLENDIINGSGRILAISLYTKTQLQRIQKSTYKSIGILPIPTDMSFFCPADHPPTTAKLGFAGRLTDPRKNAPLLFETLYEILKKGIEVELFITCEPSADLYSEIKRHGVSNSVNFTGILSQAQLKNFYQSLDIFLISSYQEGLAIVGIEAMACGVPVISTRCGGPESYIKDSKNGHLVDFNAKNMADQIYKLIKDRSHRDKLSKAARNSVVSEYGYKNFKNLLKLEMEKTWPQN